MIELVKNKMLKNVALLMKFSYEKVLSVAYIFWVLVYKKSDKKF